MSNDFPSTKFDRGKIFAKTGIRLGTNYAKRYLKQRVNSEEEDAGEKSRFHSENARQVFSEFTKLRGTALKIAQSMSMDHGTLPQEFAEVMTEAQYSVPPINRALARSIVKKELGDYPENLFHSFDADAMAAASIGQVHKAVLKDGRKVAVKIQYPNIRDTIESDLTLAKLLMKRIVKKGASIDDYFEEVKNTLFEETDYLAEGKQIEDFSRRFSSKYVTPRWIPELSTEKLLTMTFVEGRHMKEFLDEKPSQEERNHFGQLLWDFFHDQVEQRDTIHADTHPGNFLFQQNGKLGVIDFGCVKKFPESFTEKYLRLLPIHMEDNEESVRALFRELDIIRDNPKNPVKEEKFFRFCKDYGDAFAIPYKTDFFNFGEPEFKTLINSFGERFPVMNEPRGSKHFIYSVRMHTGLYSMLIKMGAEVDTRWGKQIALNTHRAMQDDQVN